MARRLPKHRQSVPGLLSEELLLWEYMTSIGERFKLALAARGIQKKMAFAAEIRVNASVVSRWQRGTGWSLQAAMRVCEALDISIDWLLLGRGTMDSHRPGKARDRL